MLLGVIVTVTVTAPVPSGPPGAVTSVVVGFASVDVLGGSGGAEGLMVISSPGSIGAESEVVTGSDAAVLLGALL